MKTFTTILTALTILLSISLEGQQIITLDKPDPKISDYGPILNCYFSPSAVCRKGSDQRTKVILGPGTWIINTTVELTLEDQLYLDYGAKLIRTSCRSTAPMIHLQGRYSSVIGSAMNVVKSECPNLSEGLIKIGQSNSTDNRNILYCRVSELVISGPSDQYPANNSTGIYIYNNQNEPRGGENSTSYFHTITDIQLTHLATGLHLYNANGCILTNLLMNRVGADGGQGILLEGAQESRISNIHHHHSPGSHSLTFKESRNSYLPAYNTIYNYVVETGRVKVPSRVPSNFNYGYCVNYDVPTDDFIDNEVNIICNHTHVAKTRSNTSYREFKARTSSKIR